MLLLKKIHCKLSLVRRWLSFDCHWPNIRSRIPHLGLRSLRIWNTWGRKTSVLKSINSRLLSTIGTVVIWPLREKNVTIIFPYAACSVNFRRLSLILEDPARWLALCFRVILVYIQVSSSMTISKRCHRFLFSYLVSIFRRQSRKNSLCSGFKNGRVASTFLASWLSCRIVCICIYCAWRTKNCSIF